MNRIELSGVLYSHTPLHVQLERLIGKSYSPMFKLTAHWIQMKFGLLISCSLTTVPRRLMQQ